MWVLVVSGSLPGGRLRIHPPSHRTSHQRCALGGALDVFIMGGCGPPKARTRRGTRVRLRPRKRASTAVVLRELRACCGNSLRAPRALGVPSGTETQASPRAHVAGAPGVLRELPAGVPPGPLGRTDHPPPWRWLEHSSSGVRSLQGRAERPEAAAQGDADAAPQAPGAARGGPRAPLLCSSHRHGGGYIGANNATPKPCPKGPKPPSSSPTHPPTAAASDTHHWLHLPAHASSFPQTHKRVGPSAICGLRP